MKYLISQQWDNINGNHAGFPHICKLLKESFPSEYTVIECPPFRVKPRSSFIGKVILHLFRPLIAKLEYEQSLMDRCSSMFKMLKEGDEVFLLEYNLPQTPQIRLAKYIKKNFKDVLIISMTHLTPSKLESLKFDKKKLLKWDKPVDKHITLGSSLSSFFISIGISPNKISTGFHAVDMDYYHPLDNKKENNRIVIITMGAIQRDYSMLSEVVKKCPKVDWIICKGKKDVGNLFANMTNVKLVGFVEEGELRQLMNEADVSLNILEDTIGSNVIVTSMAMGLAMIVSDVGSIRDYCNDNNTLFCENSVDSFVNAVNSLNDKTKISAMKQASLDIVKKYSVENTHKWFSSI